jgi:hypothetical protein
MSTATIAAYIVNGFPILVSWPAPIMVQTAMALDEWVLWTLLPQLYLSAPIWLEMRDARWQTYGDYITSGYLHLLWGQWTPRIQVPAWVTEFGLNWTDFHSSTAMTDETRDRVGFPYPRDFDARWAEGTIILNTLEGKPIIFKKSPLGTRCYSASTGKFLRRLFEEPCDRCDWQDVGVVYGGVLVAKETKDGYGQSLEKEKLAKSLGCVEVISHSLTRPSLCWEWRILLACGWSTE